MNLANKTFNKIVLQCFLSVFILQMACIPIVYLHNILEIKGSSSPFPLYMLIFFGLFIFKLIAIIYISKKIREKNKTILENKKLLSTKYFFILLTILVLVALLPLLLETTLYNQVYFWVGLDTLEPSSSNIDLLKTIIVHQLFGNFLLTSCLLCSILTFSPLKIRLSSNKKAVKEI